MYVCHHQHQRKHACENLRPEPANQIIDDIKHTSATAFHSSFSSFTLLDESSILILFRFSGTLNYKRLRVKNFITHLPTHLSTFCERFQGNCGTICCLLLSIFRFRSFVLPPSRLLHTLAYYKHEPWRSIKQALIYAVNISIFHLAISGYFFCQKLRYVQSHFIAGTQVSLRIFIPLGWVCPVPLFCARFEF